MEGDERHDIRGGRLYRKRGEGKSVTVGRERERGRWR